MIKLSDLMKKIDWFEWCVKNERSCETLHCEANELKIIIDEKLNDKRLSDKNFYFLLEKREIVYHYTFLFNCEEREKINEKK